MDRPPAIPQRPTWVELEAHLRGLMRLSGSEHVCVRLGPAEFSVYRDETNLSEPVSHMALTISPHGHYCVAAEALHGVLRQLFPDPVESRKEA